MTTRKKLLYTGASVLVMLLVGYVFFMHTNRGSSIAVYTIGGWGAPVSVKWRCGAETDRNVENKFTLPLLFDEDTKDELRGFWYYSYFRQCLYDHGYDFKGKEIPKSILSGDTYTNPYGGFSFPISGNATLLTSNELDVDFHDQLLVSTIEVDDNTLFVHTYLKDDDFTTFDSLKNSLQHISIREADITNSDVIHNAYGLDVLRLRDTDGTEGVVFLTPDLHVVYIYGSSQLDSILDLIARNVRAI